MEQSPRLKQLLSLLETTPKDSFITFAIAKEYEYLGNSKEALNYYLTLESNDPDYVGTYYHLGKLYETMEQNDKAILTYDHGIEICKKAKDWHALSELNNAKTNLEMEL